MRLFRGLIIAILALPIAELAAFVVVGALIGFGAALALLVAMSFAGYLVLRYVGARASRIRAVFTDGFGREQISVLRADSSGAAIMMAGVLLLIPGFLTGCLGLLMLIGPLRRAVAGLVAPGAPRGDNDNIVDLKPGDWRDIPDPQLPDQRRDDDRP